jgi:hypothetical protein
MDKTREAYSRLYGRDLVDAMAGEWKVGGDFKRILCALAKKHPDRIEESPDIAADVAQMRKAWGGVNHDRSHCRLAKFRGLMYSMGCNTAMRLSEKPIA